MLKTIPSRFAKVLCKNSEEYFETEAIQHRGLEGFNFTFGESVMKIGLINFALLSALLVGTGCTSSESKTAGAKKYKIAVTVDESAALKGKKASDEVAEEEAEDADDESKDQGQCKGFFGDGEVADVIKVAGSKQTVEVNAEDAIALRITGNQNIVNISFIGEDSGEEEEVAAQLADPEVEIETGTVSDSTPDSAAGDGEENGEEGTGSDGAGTEGEEVALPQFKGICIFMAGNQAKANVTVKNAQLGKFGLIARGNQAEMNLSVGAKGEVSEFFIDGKGNEPVLNVEGEGKYSCPSADEFGRGTVNCTDPAAKQDEAANP